MPSSSRSTLTQLTTCTPANVPSPPPFYFNTPMILRINPRLPMLCCVLLHFFACMVAESNFSERQVDMKFQESSRSHHDLEVAWLHHSWSSSKVLGGSGIINPMVLFFGLARIKLIWHSRTNWNSIVGCTVQPSLGESGGFLFCRFAN